MKYIKSINESINQKVFIFGYNNSDLAVDILGVFDTEEDMDNHILNYINNDILEEYENYELSNDESDKDDEDEGPYSVGDYTDEKDSEGRYIFIDVKKAIDWFNNEKGREDPYGSGHWYGLFVYRKEISKVELDQRTKEYIDIKKYNL